MQVTVETVAQIKDDIQVLIKEHWEEIAHNKDVIPLDPNYDLYEKMEAAGRLIICAARLEGELIGYSLFFLTYPMHYQTTLVATNDLLFMRKAYRGSHYGVSLIRESEAKVLALGAKKVAWHIKPEHDFSPILKKMGYQLDEILYAKVGG